MRAPAVPVEVQSGGSKLLPRILNAVSLEWEMSGVNDWPTRSRPFCNNVGAWQSLPSVFQISFVSPVAGSSFARPCPYPAT